METLAAWAWLPVAFYALTAGAGLLAERAARLRLPDLLLAPTGAAALLVVVTPVYRLGGSAAIAAPVAVALALAGLVLARRELRRLAAPLTVGVGLAAYAIYLAPVAASGELTFGGYEFVNDTAAHLIYADHVAAHGVRSPAVVDSTAAVIASASTSQSYPLGAHFLLATVRPLTGASLAAVFQPLIAACAALGAMAFAQLARGAGLPARAAACAGVLAVGSNLLYQYALHGGLKEVLAVTLLATAAALGRETLERGLALGAAALTALALAPLAVVFSAVGWLYAAVLAVCLLVALLVSPQRPPLARVARVVGAGAVVAALALLPTLVDTLDFGRMASRAFAETGGSSTAYLGHLARPLPLEQTAGVWFAPDYRFRASPPLELPNAIGIVLVLALAALGVLAELRSRRLVALLYLVPVGVAAAVLTARLSPYADSKLLVVGAPALVLAAAVGLWALARRGGAARALAIVASVAVAGSVLLSDAIAYREARLAPAQRMAALQDVGRRLGDGGSWLFWEWEEYGKFFLRDARVNSAFESESPLPVALRNPELPLFGKFYDLDAAQLDYLLRFDGIVTRRSPVTSRPPASFRLAYRNDFYELWRRAPAPLVLEHMPLQGRYEAAVEASCASVRRLAARAGAGERLVAARRPEVPYIDPAWLLRSPGWDMREDGRGTVKVSAPGFTRGYVETRAGRHRVWIAGSFGRPVNAFVDGRRVGSVDDVNTPGQWLAAGTVSLGAGRHEVDLRSGAASLAPGDGLDGAIGPIAFEPLGRARGLVSVAPREAGRLCGRGWDWVERVRGRAP